MRTKSLPSRSLAFLAVSALLAVQALAAEDVTVMTSGGFTAAYLELMPLFERMASEKLVTAATTMGTGAAFIPSRLQRGEPADVVIVADDSLRQMIKDGLVLADSRVELARSNIGMAVRAGAPRPDISSLAAFRATLLEAKSIAYSASVSGTYLTTELFQRLGIADQVLPKSRRIDTERVGNVVARGEAEIGFQQIAELLPVPGIDFVGPLPPEVQRTTVFSAGIAAQSQNVNAARALIRFLASPAAAAAITKSGLEPMVDVSVGLISEQARSSLAGIASDGTGSYMPGVTITLSMDGGGQREEVTNQEGRYRIDRLPPGSYRAEAALRGFHTVVLEPLGLQPGQESTWNPVIQFPPWTGLPVALYIGTLTGAGAVDCGRHPVGADRKTLQKALNCARDAVRRKAPFWTIQEQFSMDSEIMNGLLAAPGGETMYFRYDSSPGGSFAGPAFFHVDPCRAPKLRTDRYRVEGQVYSLFSFGC